jgi:hypothetical protein
VARSGTEARYVIAIVKLRKKNLSTYHFGSGATTNSHKATTDAREHAGHQPKDSRITAKDRPTDRKLSKALGRSVRTGIHCHGISGRGNAEASYFREAS